MFNFAYDAGKILSTLVVFFGFSAFVIFIFGGRVDR